MRRPAQEHTPLPDDPIPDLSQLTISPSVAPSSLGLSISDDHDERLIASTRVPTTPLPEIATPLPAQQHRPLHSSTPGALSVNVTVHAHRANVVITTSNPPGAGRRRQHAAAAKPTPTADSATSLSAATSPAERRPAQEPAYTIRGGGKAVIWDPCLEHIEPRDPNHRRKWYVVTAGLRVGIWKSWLAMEDYVDVKGKRYQSYETREEAEKQYYEAKQEGRVRLLIK